MYESVYIVFHPAEQFPQLLYMLCLMHPRSFMQEVFFKSKNTRYTVMSIFGLRQFLKVKYLVFELKDNI